MLPARHAPNPYCVAFALPSCNHSASEQRAPPAPGDCRPLEYEVSALATRPKAE